MCSTFAGGTVQAIGVFSQQTFTRAVQTIAQPSPGNLLTTSYTPTANTQYLNSAATTNATNYRTFATTVFNISAINSGTAVAFLKLYNKASAPVVGTDIPVLVLSIPANGVPLNMPLGTIGQRFSLGVGIAITNLIADTDTTAVAAGQVKTAITYL